MYISTYHPLHLSSSPSNISPSISSPYIILSIYHLHLPSSPSSSPSIILHLSSPSIIISIYHLYLSSSPFFILSIFHPLHLSSSSSIILSIYHLLHLSTPSIILSIYHPPPLLHYHQHHHHHHQPSSPPPPIGKYCYTNNVANEAVWHPIVGHNFIKRHVGVRFMFLLHDTAWTLTKGAAILANFKTAAHSTHIRTHKLTF